MRKLSPSTSVRAWRPLALLALCLAPAACHFEMKSLTRPGAMAPTAEKCGSCHVDIYREWRNSKHASAWTNPSFTAETLNHQVKSCLPCHAPVTVFSATAQLQTRNYKLDEGVTCVGCHLIRGKHHGPFIAGPVTPHGTQADPDLYHSAALCGKCHTGTYDQWKVAQAADPKTRTCQQCHMPGTRRKLTQATDLLSKGIVALHEEHAVRRHEFTAAIDPEGGAVAIEVAAPTPTTCTVTVLNQLPHSIPEGDFGFRRATLSVQMLDARDRPVTSATRELYKDLGTQLKSGQRLSLSLPLGGLNPAQARVKVQLKRTLIDGSVGYVITETSGSLAAGRLPTP